MGAVQPTTGRLPAVKTCQEGTSDRSESDRLREAGLSREDAGLSREDDEPDAPARMPDDIAVRLEKLRVVATAHDDDLTYGFPAPR